MEHLSLVQDLRDPDDDAGGITPEDAERRQAATDHWREAKVDFPAVSPMPPITLTATKPMHTSMKPRYDLRATQTAKKSLTAMIGLPKLAAFVGSHGGWMLSNLAKILPAELARITAGGTPAAVTTAPAAPRQLIRLGSSGTPAAVPTKPATAPKPSTPSKTSEFIPAKPTAKPRAAGECPAGAFGIDEAERRTREVFGSIPAMGLTANEKSRWASLESVYRVNGFAAPWADNANKTDTQIAKLNGPLFARRAKLIASLFQS